MCAATIAMTACTATPTYLEAASAGQIGVAGSGGDPPAAQTHSPSPAVSVLASTAPDALTVAFAKRLFSSAPVVVVAASGRTTVAAAARAATAAHAPLLLSAAAVSAPLLAEIADLRPSSVLAVGVPPATLAARLPGVQVVTSAAKLPATAAPSPLRHVAVLIHRGSGGTAVAAVTATARVAGATVVAVKGNDPRTDPAAIRALARARPRAVLAIGRGFGPGRLAARVAVAATGRQLPGGGQVLFPGHRLVALYGHPGTPGLGVLGDQDLAASIERARAVAAQYRPLSRVPVVPAFEIIATVAQAAARPGRDLLL